MELDSGAAVSIMPLHLYRSHFSLPLKPSTLSLRGVSGPIKIAGEVQVRVFCLGGKVSAVLPLVVCDSSHLKYPLLGRNWPDKLLPSWRESCSRENVSEIDNTVADYPVMFAQRFPKIFANSASAITGFSVNLTVSYLCFVDLTRFHLRCKI